MISADKKHQKDSKKKVVIAIGGNAILQKNQIGTFLVFFIYTNQEVSISFKLYKRSETISLISHQFYPVYPQLLFQVSVLVPN